MLRQLRTPLPNPINSMASNIISSSRSMVNISLTSRIKLTHRIPNMASMLNTSNSSINMRNISHNHNTTNSIMLHLSRLRSI
ncbi:hypothetical protein ONZ43_g1730 [Nemania bipapillata]|uniref:Uncharacterized protein n=1 Tax=Nemania bipapillata TaxID=110536 RepID=A0ACC2J3C9_9PEZI|nr:hypothetical protein ONZ43_g1730 [Nemania bipapillata]